MWEKGMRGMRCRGVYSIVSVQGGQGVEDVGIGCVQGM